VNDNKKIDGNPQVIKCLSCYMHVFNPTTKGRKLLITYYKANGIIALKKHVNNDHATFVKQIEEKINILSRKSFEKQLTKKMNECFKKCIIYIFSIKVFFLK
jgi:hypothetical protein